MAGRAPCMRESSSSHAANQQSDKVPLDMWCKGRCLLPSNRLPLSRLCCLLDQGNAYCACVPCLAATTHLTSPGTSRRILRSADLERKAKGPRATWMSPPLGPKSNCTWQQGRALFGQVHIVSTAAGHGSTGQEIVLRPNNISCGGTNAHGRPQYIDRTDAIRGDCTSDAVE